MRNNTTPTSRSVMALVALIVGILLITLVPASGMRAMDAILKGYEVKITAVPDPSQLLPASTVVAFFFPFWTALCMVAGAALIVLSAPIYRGEYWARPIALGLLAVPSIAGAYMFGPTFFFAKDAISDPLIIGLTGIVAYFIILLYEKSSVSEKVINFFVFLMLGAACAYNWTIGHASLRLLWANPDPNVVDHAYALGIVVNWTAVLLVMIGIPLLAARKPAGWWLCTVGSFAMFVGSGTLLLAYPDVMDFQAGTLIALVTCILLFIPKISRLMIDNPSDKAGANKIELIPQLTASKTDHSA